jgi:hypothetical protein
MKFTSRIVEGLAPGRVLSDGQGAYFGLRTLLAGMFNSAIFSGVRRQPVGTAIHPVGSSYCTSAAAVLRGVAAAQNSVCPSLVAATT